MLQPILLEPTYHIQGWFRKRHITLGNCVFSIDLDARFAERARNFSFGSQDVFEKRMRDIVGYKYVRTTFLDGTLFLRSMSVEGDCACLGVSGSILDRDWSGMPFLTYHGHNVDSKSQAYDLLTIFTNWIDVAGAFIGRENKR